MIWACFKLFTRMSIKLAWLLVGFMLGIKVARSQTINHTQSHVSYQEKQHHNSSITKLERRVALDQRQNRRRRVAIDSSCLVAHSDKTRYNTHMYQILKNGTLLINADNLETAVVYVKSLESNLDRNTQHSPYTIRRVHQDGSLDMSNLNDTPKAIWPPVAGPRDHPCPR